MTGMAASAARGESAPRAPLCVYYRKNGALRYAASGVAALVAAAATHGALRSAPAGMALGDGLPRALLYAFTVLTAAYLPHLLDGAELTPEARFEQERFSRGSRWLRAFFERNGLVPEMVFEGGGAKALAADGDTQFIFASHPHGPLSAHHFCMYMEDLDEDFTRIAPPRRRRALAARTLFLIPGWREQILRSGAVDASRATAEACLRKGFSLTVLPGGEREQLLAREGDHTVYLKRRKGFCRLAVRSGVPLVPCYCFGETSMYRTSDFLMGVRRWISDRFYVALPLFYGDCWWNPLRPRPTRLRICVGRPIRPPRPSAERAQEKALPAGERPETEKEELRRLTDELHATYCAALRKLFDDHKAAAGCPGATLRIV